MSEYISGSKERIEALFQLFSGYIEEKNGRELWDLYRDKVEALTPVDVLLMGDRLMEAGYSTTQITDNVEKIFNIIIPILKEYDWAEPEEGSALYYLMEENLALTGHMNDMKLKIKELGEVEVGEERYREVYQSLKADFRRLAEFDPHYLKVENVLFPYLEKTWEFHKPLQVIWAVNDDIRTTVKQINYMLDQRDDLRIEEHQVIGSLFMLMMRMTYKENLVILPAAAATMDKKISDEMLPHFADIGFCFIETPDVKKSETTEGDFSGSVIDMGGTGALNVSQMIMMMNHLPVDVTFVDENDEVRYFSNPKDRFFTRSPAIIGRKVQNCHPSDSIDTVNRIVTSFKNGEQDSAKFWIRMQGKVIMINYYAVRDKAGNYKGTIEVSQDITEIQQLEGERRLLEWDK